MSATLLDRARTTLVVVDVQEAFRTVIPGFEEITRRCAILASASATLGVPVIVTEQYPRGLGATVDELAAALGDAPRLEKTAFSAARAGGFALPDGAQVLLCGVETHVCVAQTALDLLAAGHEVHVATDAVGSRSAEDRAVGLARMQAAGAITSSTEMALFELLGAAGGEEFKTVQGLIK